MKQQFMTRKIFFALSTVSLLMTACQKSNDVQTTDTSTGDISDASSVAATISVLASTNTASSDSVYIVQPCQRGSSRNAVAQADLPTTVAAYLNTAYNGYTFHEAFAIKDTTGTVTGYAVIIYYDGKPVGLEFDSAGAFVKVLEQRERGDLRGPEYHQGGRFQHRDGKNRDTVALNTLPAAALTYFASNYSTDTLLKAYKQIDSSYVVLSKNTGLFATVFDADGNFIKRETLPAPNGDGTTAVQESELPQAITAYLGATYPSYVFKKAFAVTGSDGVQGYVVLIDANNTKYAVAFDASGTFLSAKAVC